MKLLKKLTAYNEEEIEGAAIGLGAIKAMNYDTQRRGHLLLFSLNIKGVRFIKKLFIRI